MKKIISLILAVNFIGISGCVKDPYINHPYGEGKGNITFYSDASILLNEYPITIQVDQQTIGTLTRNYLNFSVNHPNTTEPLCGETNAGMVINYVGTAGSHSFKALGSYGGSSSGNFTITADQCIKKKISQ